MLPLLDKAQKSVERPDSILSEDEDAADKSGGTNTFGDKAGGKKGAF